MLDDGRTLLSTNGIIAVLSGQPGTNTMLLHSSCFWCCVSCPVSCCSYMYLGVALSRLDDFDNACAAYNKAINMDPAEPMFRLNFGEQWPTLWEEQVLLGMNSDGAGAGTSYDMSSQFTSR